MVIGYQGTIYSRGRVPPSYFHHFFLSLHLQTLSLLSKTPSSSFFNSILQIFPSNYTLFTHITSNSFFNLYSCLPPRSISFGLRAWRRWHQDSQTFLFHFSFPKVLFNSFPFLSYGLLTLSSLVISWKTIG